MEKISCIYAIRNIETGKQYVGSAKSFSDRKDVHLSSLRKGKHHSILLQRAFSKYGESSFIFEILETVEETSLLTREQFFLDTLKTYDPSIGYNICKVAGSQLGRKHTEDSKAKISKSSKGRGLGRTLSEDTKKKISEAKTGKPISLTKKFKEGSKKSALTRTKLTTEQVLHIQNTKPYFGMQSHFAWLFGVSKQTISRVINKEGLAYL